MRTTEHAFDASLTRPKPIASRLDGFARLVKTVSRMIRNRAQINRLHELDDYLLMDMGLRREDLRDAMTSPFFSDPGAHLTRVARTRIQTFYRDARNS